MLQWDASNVSSGVYVIRMQIDDKIKTNIIKADIIYKEKDLHILEV